jgi:hypothetical protein
VFFSVTTPPHVDRVRRTFYDEFRRAGLVPSIKLDGPALAA